MSEAAAVEAATARLGGRTILAAVLGNTLEWYDFAVYGFMAPIIGAAFFPSDDPVASLLAAYGVLAVGYASRPLGSIIFGHIGDRVGRKPALLLAVAIMGVATFAIGALPDAAVLGTAAAVLLVLLRGLQGICVAGEYASSAVLLVEQAPPERRGLIGSWIVFGSNGGFLLGSAVGALVSNLMDEATMHAWGWRIPFFLGAGIAAYVFVLRTGMSESPVMESAEPAPRLPAVEALRDHWRAMLRLVCLLLPIGVTYFMVFVYAISYLTEYMHVSTARALDISTIALVLLLTIGPLAGLASDRVGRRPVMFFATVGSFLLTWPLWYLMHVDNFAWILVGQLGFAFINGIAWAMSVPLMVELLPARVRCSAAGMGYNFCMGLFGGTTPFVATYLVARSADDFAPAYYAMAFGVIAFIAALRLPETAGRPLPE